MAYVEKNGKALQIVIHHLKKSGDGLEFVLFPMIHLGTQEFYDEVSQRLDACDLVLVEGIKSKRVSLMTLPYRLAAKSVRLNLVSQHRALKTSSFKHKLVASDLEGHSFAEGWSNLRLRWRIEFHVIEPLLALYLFFFVNREKLANYILLKDSSAEDERRDEDLENFARLLGGDRNQILIQHIKQLYNTRKNEDIKIAIPYGAKHMSRILKFLINRLGYRVIQREWVIVFDF
ncbi:MAG TPA: hypothetical protein VN920_06505 [Pyrinomonadaceae bacterium]|nr:hypothetical protein [Pyrinomonadaceae bacterium]